MFDCFRLYGLYPAPASSVHGILQARILEWVAMPSSREGLPDSGIEVTSFMSPALAGGFFTTSTTWEALLMSKNNLFGQSLIWRVPASVIRYLFSVFQLALSWSFPIWASPHWQGSVLHLLILLPMFSTVSHTVFWVLWTSILSRLHGIIYPPASRFFRKSYPPLS